MGRVKEAIQSAIDEYGDIIDASFHKTQENWAEVLLDAKLKSHHGIDAVSYTHLTLPTILLV